MTPESFLKSLLPQPRQQYLNGETWQIPQAPRILLKAPTPARQFTANYLCNGLKKQGFFPVLRVALDDATAQNHRPDIVISCNTRLFSGAQQYQLSIHESGVLLSGSDESGLFYGVCTLLQLFAIGRSCEGEAATHANESARFAEEGGTQALSLPGVVLRDRPDFAHRGVMLDISRDKVPTMDTLFALVDLLASWKINQLQLYMEHTFAYEGHESVWEHSSPMTSQDILQLDAYCQERHVELVPNQNSFGHMHRWLIHSEYRPLAECPEGVDHPFSPDREPYSICPTDPKSIALLADLYGQLLPHFQSSLFNVGFDETFDLGLGRSKELCEEKGTVQVYLQFLHEVAALAKRFGRTIQFWADIILQHEAQLNALPPDAIAMIWGYEANHAFEKQCAEVAKAGLSFYVCPGTSSWNTFAGRTQNALGNLKNAAFFGKQHGALGLLNTDWGDFGHMQPLPVSYLGFLAGAGYSWNGEGLQDAQTEDWEALLDLHVFEDRGRVMGHLACSLGDAYLQTGARSFNASPLFRLLMLSEKHTPQNTEHISLESLAKNRAYIEDCMRGFSQQQMQRGDADLIVQEMQWVADILCFSCDLASAKLNAESTEIRDIPASSRNALADTLDALLQQHRKQWLARNRPGGLDDSCRRLERILAQLRADT